ncbi:Organic cation transporter protein [Hordeum vulgare]|nr:Organic cation transporter protein [Hordeum vulgare]
MAIQGMGMLIEDYDGKKEPTVVDVYGLYVWEQIHNIPELYRKAEVVAQLARCIGRVKETQLMPRLFFEGDYVRVHARVLVTKPLTRVIPLSVAGDGRKLLLVKYEKIPYFCQVCNLMGHNHEVCGDGVWEEKHKQWGGWMLAKHQETPPEQPDAWGPRGGRSGGRGRGKARRGNPVRQNSPPQKRSSQKLA